MNSLSEFTVAGQRAELGSFRGPTGEACSECGEPMVTRSIAVAGETPIGEHCTDCDRWQVPLSRIVAVRKRPPDGPLGLPTREARYEPSPVHIRRRDRIFAFFFGLPLELSDDVDSRPPGVSLMVALCLAMFVVTGMAAPGLLQSLALETSALTWATAWQTMTSIFVHWGVIHLLGNLYFLYGFGRLPESRLGPGHFLGLFVGAGLAGNLLFLLLHLGQEMRVLGASGAVAGILGFYLICFPNRRVGWSLLFGVVRIPVLIYLGLWFYLQVLAMAGVQDHVAYAAHVGGFLYGAIFGLVWRRRVGID